MIVFLYSCHSYPACKSHLFCASLLSYVACLALPYFATLFYNQQDFRKNIMEYSGPDSSVGVATDYGLDGPGSNPSGDEIFRPSRPTLGPTQPPVKWVLGLSRV